MLRKVVLAVDGSEESKKAADLAEAIARRFGSAVLVVHVRALVYSGAAAWAPEWAPELEADLIVMGSRGRSRLADVVVGNVVDDVLHHASCPVLVVR